METSKERQLDSVFTAKETGEYMFCFNNEMSTFSEKIVDFEIAVRWPLSPVGASYARRAAPRYLCLGWVSLAGYGVLIVRFSCIGRERNAFCPPALETRHLPRTDLRP